MDEFLAASLSFPTVVFTVLLMIAMGYWLLVIVGALGLDALDFDHDHAGGVDHAHGGDAVAHADGVDGHADAHGDAHHTTAGQGLFATLFWVLKLQSVPLTIALTLVFFWGWLASHLGQHYLVGYEAHWSMSLALFAGALALSFPLASLSVRPLAPLFRTHLGQRRSALIGKIVDVDTSHVDSTFGMAKAEDGGAGLIVQIRCEAANSLERGDRALVLSFDEAREVYEVTPIDDLLPADKNTRPD